MTLGDEGGERLANWRQAFADYRRGFVSLEECGGITTESARSELVLRHDALERAHSEAGFCLGCATILDEPMAGYTSYCSHCGASHTHPLPENAQ